MNFRPRTAWAGVMWLVYPATAFLQAYSGLSIIVIKEFSSILVSTHIACRL